MNIKTLTPVYSITLLLSAFLLFAVQPLFGKMVLPLLGGAPAVWNTAMLFFQAMLLAGYAYAHATTRLLTVRAQAILHLLLLVFFFLVLPIAIPAGWEPPSESANPIFWQLALMTIAVGGPFFVLAGSAPMLQRWFAHSEHPDAHNPYFLYAASNLGSMTALLAYPFVFEPLMSTTVQSLIWSWGYGALIVMVVLSAIMIWKQGDVKEPESHAKIADKVDWHRKLTWLVLSFVPSSLMLGVTTFITTDVAAAPLLWVLPLAMYVGTFITAFARSRKLKYETLILWHSILLSAVIGLFIFDFIPPKFKFSLVALHLGLFYLSAQLCHMRLADLRPHSRHLTEFYLIMSTGGVMGGILNALIAPLLFVVPIEYALILIAVPFLTYFEKLKDYFSTLKSQIDGEAIIVSVAILGSSASAAWLWHNSQLIFPMAMLMIVLLLYATQKKHLYAFLVALVLITHPGYQWGQLAHSFKIERNYFGVLTVRNLVDRDMRGLVHGSTIHGTQPLIEDLRLTPVSYFYKPARDIFTVYDAKKGKQRIGVLGLGIGSVACYTHPERHYDFYEINPAVVEIAENPDYFTYLSDCGSPYDIILGDGRLKIAEQPDELYDLIFLDVFSSDNIPVHILTKEAFEIYRRKLKPDGLIIVNISNRYLNLAPVVNRIAKELEMTAVFKMAENGIVDEDHPSIRYFTTIYGLMANDETTLEPFKDKGWITKKAISPRAWTDDYVNLVGALWTFNGRNITD